MTKKFVVFDHMGVRHSHLIEGINDIPEGAVPVSDALFMRMTQETDGQWSIDAQGVIVKLPYIDAQELPSVEQLINKERSWRDAQISANEWLVIRHRDEKDMQLATTLGIEQFAELLQYRQSLRDWPQSELFPSVEHRPSPPAWLESMTL